MATITLGPLTRVEGHLDIQVTVATVGGVQKVTDAKSSGTMFRGFETILKGRDPFDATHITARVCGVCPISHAMASSLALEAAYNVLPTNDGRTVRNLILGSNFLQSHVLHFYHLAALDYINTTGILPMAPWQPSYVTPDMVGGSTAGTLVNHYLQALVIRRKAHQMGAIFGARMPISPALVPGGATNALDAGQVTAARALLTEIRAFINNVYIPDVTAVAGLFPQYSTIGRGCGNLLAYGVFDLDALGTHKLLSRGRYTDGVYGTVDTAQIKEYVKHSYYTAASGNLNPASGVTTPSASKSGAYSWLKAPRYLGKPHEVGALARMWINGDYRNGISVVDRIAARALETKKVADAMDGWLSSIVPGRSVYNAHGTVTAASGIGLTEAPRGALGHWVQIASSKISRYQMITPTGWNASPRDDSEVAGPIEQALIGTQVADVNQPIEVLRVVHSFDPCLSCAVHMVRPGEKAERVVAVTGCPV